MKDVDFWAFHRHSSQGKNQEGRNRERGGSVERRGLRPGCECVLAIEVQHLGDEGVSVPVAMVTPIFLLIGADAGAAF